MIIFEPRRKNEAKAIGEANKIEDRGNGK